MTIAIRRESATLPKCAPSRARSPMEAERKMRNPPMRSPASIHQSHVSTPLDVLRLARSFFKREGWFMQYRISNTKYLKMLNTEEKIKSEFSCWLFLVFRDSRLGIRYYLLTL